jgi:hypothetical protein
MCPPEQDHLLRTILTANRFCLFVTIFSAALSMLGRCSVIEWSSERLRVKARLRAERCFHAGLCLSTRPTRPFSLPVVVLKLAPSIELLRSIVNPAPCNTLRLHNHSCQAIE